MHYRHVIGPLREMPTKFHSTDFTTEEVDKQIQIGELDASHFVKHYKEGQARDKAAADAAEANGEPVVQAVRKSENCAGRKRYYNKDRQARHEAECGVIKK